MATVKAIDPAPLHLSSDDVAEHGSWALAIDAARVGALVAAAGEVETRRSTLPLEGGWMRLMAASVPALGVFGYKEFHLAADNSVRYCIKVFDSATGRPRGIVDAALITTLRTAATAAVALEHIVGSQSPVRLALVGSGAEALAGLGALQEVVKLDDVRVTSRSPQNRSAFVEQARLRTGLDVRPEASLAAAVSAADVVYAATNSGGRIVVRHADVADVPVIASIGSTIPEQRELAGDVLSEADRVIVDTHEVFEESGDALEAIAAGFDPAGATELGAALRADETPDPSRRTVYKSIGTPVQDIVLAARLVQAAEDQGFGRRVTPLSAVKVNL